MESNGEAESSVGVSGKDRRVGLIFDERMCKHYAPDGEDHPECPDRVRVIWERLNSSGLAKRCIILSAKDVEDNHLALVHTKSHIDLIKNISSRNPASRRKKIAAKFNSIYFNEGSTEAASLAAGSVIEAAEKVAKGELDSAFAIVRPPGHHAEEGEPMGFCLYNNVGIATSFLLNERRELGINKILIVDWDVHHGNGTQKMFYNDSRVLFFSVHRYDYGTFYPAGHDGSHIMTGEGPGAGHNINVPWEHGRCGDADYLAVWDHILIPVAKEFDPDMIIISAGFDAAIGDPLGGCRISPYGYSIMLDKLMEFAGGKIVMALEGGYNLNSIASSARACVEVLLCDKPPNVVLEAYPFDSTWRVIQEVRQELSKYWPVLAVELPEKMIRKTAEIEILGSDSESETENITLAVSEEVQTIEDIIQPFSNLKVNLECQDHEVATVRPLWRSELSKVDIWYATYGSNMSMPRFRCYIEGGQIEGMIRPCVGSMDKSKPKENIWKTFPHRLFFARDRTATWGPGGVAFLHPKSNVQEKTYMCLYKITLEQFNDVLLQENISNHDMSHPLLDLTALQTIQTEKSLSGDLVQGGWYHNVVYLGKEEDIPILTMTCSLSDVESFISGKVPINPPCKEYANTLIKGLVEGKQLLEEEASAYIEKASTKPLMSAPKKGAPLPITSSAPEVERVEAIGVDPSPIPTQLPIVPVQLSIPSSSVKGKFSEIDTFCRSIKAALLEPPLESGSDIASRSTNCYRDLAEVMYNNFLIARDTAGEWRDSRERMSSMSSLLKEARDLKTSLEGKILKLRAVVEEEKKIKEEAKREASAAVDRCSRTMKRLEDLRGATADREDGLNKVINELEAKVKLQAENELKSNSYISELRTSVSKLRKGEGVDWEVAVEAEDFAPVRETLFSLAMKSAKDLIQVEYPELKLDFLVVEEEGELKDTQSETANLGAEGKKITTPIHEAVNQEPENTSTSKTS